MPRAPKFCGTPGCTERVVGKPYCVDHQPTAWAGPHHRGSTWAWRKLRAEVLEEEPVCMDCGRAPSTDAGHVVGRAQGGQDVRYNLKGQCRPCNLAQMQADRRSV